MLMQLEKALAEHERLSQLQTRQQRERMGQRLASVRRRIDQAYMDKLDGKVSEDFWQAKTAEWRLEEQQLVTAVQLLQQINSVRHLNAKKILELGGKAHFLYRLQSAPEQGKLLKTLLLNCRLDGANLYPTYRKPFDLIFGMAK
jgi:hypothetical protein